MSFLMKRMILDALDSFLFYFKIPLEASKRQETKDSKISLKGSTEAEELTLAPCCCG